MRKIAKKFLASLLALGMCLTPMAAMNVNAVNVAHTTDVVITKWDTTNITKNPTAELETEGTEVTPFDHDGKEITDPAAKLGLSGAPKGVAGVKFKAYKLPEGADDTALVNGIKALSTVTEIDAYIAKQNAAAKVAVTETNETGTNGDVEVTLEDGIYWIVEIAPSNFEKGIAVPFELKLPAFVDGKRVGDAGAAEKLYVYPKNVFKDPFDPRDPGNEGKPALTKKVEGGDDKNFKSVTEGEVTKWLVSALTPKTIKQYKKLEILDKLSSKLITNGTKDSVTLAQEENTETFTVGADYNVTLADRLLKITFTDTGIAKLMPEKRINISFTTKIDPTKTIMGDRIYNGIKVDYQGEDGKDGSSVIPPNPTEDPKVIKPGDPKEDPKDPDDIPVGTVPGDNKPGNIIPPNIAVGGRVFEKVDFNTTTDKLKDAEFIVVRKVTTEAAGTTYQVLTENQGWEPLAATNADSTALELRGLAVKVTGVKKLKSGEEGKFELKNVAFGDYELIETVAPNGYALRDEKIAFTIDKNSYYSDTTLTNPATYNTTASDVPATEVTNKKYTIPQTGGIGTLVFIFTGLALMGGALYLFKRSRKESE